MVQGQKEAEDLERWAMAQRRELLPPLSRLEGAAAGLLDLDSEAERFGDSGGEAGLAGTQQAVPDQFQ